jgi:hypothetical protein
LPFGFSFSTKMGAPGLDSETWESETLNQPQLLRKL